jgi:hypothetical protein
MRLLDLKQLNEAGLSIDQLKKYDDQISSPTPYLRANKFLSKIERNEEFELVGGEKVVIKPEEYDKLLQIFNAGTIPGQTINIQLANGQTKRLTQFQKTTDLGGKGGGGEGLANRGDAAEGILGASLFAKLTARTRGKIDTINPTNIWNIIDILKQTQEDHYSVQIKDATKNVAKDSIQFTLKLKPGPYKDIMDPKKRSLLTNEINSAVAYANSADAQEYCEYFYLNGKPDVIHVITDGISGSTTKKSDVEVITTDPTTGKSVRQQLNISLKTLSDTMGQVGQGEKGEEFNAQKKLWDSFGIDIESSRNEFDTLVSEQGLPVGIEKIYRDATVFLQDLLAGSFDDAEYLFLKDLVKGIDYFATLNDPTVIMVSLEGGTYDVMSFANLQKQLKNIDLDARYNEKAANPQIEIYDINSGMQLFRIRSKKEKVKNGQWYIRNYIEKGPLLSELTSIKR